MGNVLRNALKAVGLKSSYRGSCITEESQPNLSRANGDNQLRLFKSAGQQELLKVTTPTLLVPPSLNRFGERPPKRLFLVVAMIGYLSAVNTFSRCFRIAVLTLMLLGLTSTIADARCNKKFLNPISEVCWDCIFPISIGGLSLFGSRPDTDNPSFPLCLCPGLPPRIGLAIGLWEPARLVDVAAEPGCFVNMGFNLDFGLFGAGNQSKRGNTSQPGGSTWHAHYYYYPLISWLGTIVDGLCFQTTLFDVAYVSELDPLWNDSELNSIIQPEAVLFANPIAQAACAADCVKASSGGLGLNSLFWCDGCDGPVYPITGDANSHVGGVQASKNVATKLQARMHRLLLSRRTGGSSALCQPKISPIIPKQYYRQQITRPSAATSGRFACAPVGSSPTFVDFMRERPFVGESFGWLHWRKRNCCAL